MINIKLSQYDLFHLGGLTNEQMEEIEVAKENATQFIEAGTKKYPVVDFYIENDCLLDPQKCFGGYYDGKGIKARYGLLPKSDDGLIPQINNGRIRIIHLTAAFLDSKLINEPIIPELKPLTLSKFNKYAHKTCPLKPMDYENSVEATHVIKFYNMPAITATFPLDFWDESVSLHYLSNELNSNRKWIDPEGKDERVFDVVRFLNGMTHMVEYYADVYEHTPDGTVSYAQRNFLFKKVEETGIFYED